MREYTFQQLVEIIENEKAITLKNVSTVIGGLLRQSNDEYGEFGEYDYKRDSRTKMRDIAKMIVDESLVVYSNSNDYHNLAVDYARQNMYDCALWILRRAIKQYPHSTDLLADTILYGKESGMLDECENALASLKMVDKLSWGWRAYSFAIDYCLDKLNQLPRGQERSKLKKAIHKLADEFIEYSQCHKETLDRAYCKKAEVIRDLGGECSQEDYLLMGYEKSQSAPMCALGLADLMFKQGDYSKVVFYLRTCLNAVNAPQPDINASYVYLLYAMSRTSKLMMDTPEGDFSSKTAEIETIYKDFHTAIQGCGMDRTYEDAAKNAIRMIEIQTGIKDRTPEMDEEDF